jgi:hypothetical protein
MALRITLLAAAACLAALAIVPSAFAGKQMEVAVQDDAVLVALLYGTPENGLELAEDLNASWVRANVSWGYVVGGQVNDKTEPTGVDYNWTGYDALVDAAAARGIQVQLALVGPAPAWATSNHKVGPMKPDAEAYRRFVAAAAEHFKGRVHRYSIWNEPNHIGWLAPKKSAAKVYRSMYIRGYAAIKAVDPEAQVLIAETSPYSRGKNASAPLAFLRGVTCANKRYKRAKKCSRLLTDGYAHHPYDFDHKPTYRYKGKDNVTLATLGRLTSALGKLKKARLLTTPAGGTPYLYLTEYGYFSSGKRGLKAKTHARYLVKGFEMAVRNKRVKQLLQYLLYEPSSLYHGFDTSIATFEGAPTYAFKKLAAWTNRAVKLGRIRPRGTPVAPPPPPPPPPDDGGGGGGGILPPSGCAPLPVCP